MDYSNRGIMIMLQDLQRFYFGRLTVYVNVTLPDEKDNDPIVSCTVFDNEGEAHVFSFYSFDNGHIRKKEYQALLAMIDSITNKKNDYGSNSN